MQLTHTAHTIQGLDLHDIAEQFGTPLYIYDAERIEAQYNRLHNAFSGLDMRIHYAMKALSNLSILKFIKKLGGEIDTVSIYEVHAALKAGFAPAQIMFTPNCTDFSEIEEAVALGVVVNVDNLPFLEKFGQKYGSGYPVCIRINPHITAGGNHKIQTGHKASKFGISIDQKSEIKETVKKYNLNINGLHVHTGSDIYDVNVFLQGAEIMFGLAMEYPGLKFIDFGSGFKVPYKPGDKSTDIEKLGTEFRKVYEDFCNNYGSKPQVWFEPGKFLVSDSGILLARVNLVKTTPGATFAGVNSGLNHLIRPMMYDAYHHIINVSNPEGKEGQYTVSGYICETDNFGTDLTINEVREGDLLAIKNAGAYGFSMSSNYNSRPRPAEILVYKGKAHLIREAETAEDLFKHQVEFNFE